MTQHPVDQLIRELIQMRRPARPTDVEQIIALMTAAPFDSGIVAVPGQERGARYRDIILTARVPSLDYHLVKRVALEHQWADGTTAQDYVADLRRVARLPEARLAVYERRGGNIAAVVAATEDAVPQQRRGSRSEPHLVVIYSADRGIMVTGYQFSNISTVGIAPGAQWLK